jgi:hypothetical protein
MTDDERAGRELADQLKEEARVELSLLLSLLGADLREPASAA